MSDCIEQHLNSRCCLTCGVREQSSEEDSDGCRCDNVRQVHQSLHEIETLKLELSICEPSREEQCQEDLRNEADDPHYECRIERTQYLIESELVSKDIAEVIKTYEQIISCSISLLKETGRSVNLRLVVCDSNINCCECLISFINSLFVTGCNCSIISSLCSRESSLRLIELSLSLLCILIFSCLIEFLILV